MAWIYALIVFFGTGFIDGERGKATWYGSTRERLTYCYDGYKSTCTPYSSGEQVFYAASGSFRNNRDRPYSVVVENLANGKRITVVVRDRCTGCRTDGTGGKIIDLSPAAFLRLTGHLSRGVLKVRIYGEKWNNGMAAGN